MVSLADSLRIFEYPVGKSAGLAQNISIFKTERRSRFRLKPEKLPNRVNFTSKKSSICIRRGGKHRSCVRNTHALIQCCVESLEHAEYDSAFIDSQFCVNLDYAWKQSVSTFRFKSCPSHAFFFTRLRGDRELKISGFLILGIPCQDHVS